MLYLIWGNSRPPTKRISWSELKSSNRMFVGLIVPEILQCIDFGLKLPIHAPFWGVFGAYFPHMTSLIVQTPKRTVLVWKHVV